MRPVVCIVGPTGAGKTAAAVHLAQALGGGVVNLDSRQVYRGLEIVTAQPTEEERRGVPHLLYGFLDPGEPMSAGRFAQLARAAMASLHGQGLLPLLVGGTGLYLKSLLGGLAEIPDVPAEVRAHWQRQCADLGPEALHARLREVDPDTAARVMPRDRQRITRALEVLEATGRPLSAWHAETPGRAEFAVLRLGVALERPLLFARLEARIQAMLDAGALEEMRAAHAACPDAAAPGFTGIGCRELLDHLQGRADLDTARAAWLKRTRDYAKRQLTWFGKDDVRWFAPHDAPGMLAAAREFLAALPSAGGQGS